MLKILPIGAYALFVLLSLPTLGQIHNPVNRELDKAMEIAKSQMVKGDYEGANITFRKILKENKVLPTDLSYLFAETLYKIGQFQNSQNFLDRYLSLTDQGDDYHKEAKNLQKYLEAEFKDIRSCQRCDIRGYRLLTCHKCEGQGSTLKPCHYCKQAGIVFCQKCRGEGVIIRMDNFGEKVYETCDLCSSRGFHTCPVCHGDKQLDTSCPVCLGSGQESSDTLCSHDDGDGHGTGHKDEGQEK